MTTKYTIFTALLLVTLGHASSGKPKFSDQQIMAMAPHYFKRMQSGASGGVQSKFLGANIYRHPQRGKVFQVDIRVNRNKETQGLAQAFTAMLNLSRYFSKGPDFFVAIIHSTVRNKSPVICTGDAKCTADHYLYRRITYDQWYKKCITFEQTWTFGIAPDRALP